MIFEKKMLFSLLVSGLIERRVISLFFLFGNEIAFT